HVRVPGANALDFDQLGIAQIDRLEQAVYRIADVERTQAVTASPDRPEGRHPHEALGVVAIRAALERRQRGERQPAYRLERWYRDRNELGQAGRNRGRRLAAVQEEGELRRLLDGALLVDGHVVAWLRVVAVDAD